MASSNEPYNHAQNADDFDAWAAVWTVVRDVFGPTLAFILTIAIGTAVLGYLLSRIRIQDSIPAIIAFGTLGGLIGLFTGASKTPVVGSLLPALLTFMAGILTYLFTRDSLSELRPIIPYCIISLIAAGIFGGFFGSEIRKTHIVGERRYEEWRLRYEKVELPIILKVKEFEFELGKQSAQSKFKEQ